MRGSFGSLSWLCLELEPEALILLRVYVEDWLLAANFNLCGIKEIGRLGWGQPGVLQAPNHQGARRKSPLLFSVGCACGLE